MLAKNYLPNIKLGLELIYSSVRCATLKTPCRPKEEHFKGNENQWPQLPQKKFHLLQAITQSSFLASYGELKQGKVTSNLIIEETISPPQM